MSPCSLFSLILSSQFWCKNLAINACRHLPDTEVSVIPILPGETVKLRCYTLHNCLHWSWEIRTDTGTKKLIPGTCKDCSSSYEIVQNQPGVNILVVYNVSGWVTEEYTCSCEWKLQNSLLLTRSTEGCFQLITYNNFTTENPLALNFIEHNVTVQNSSMDQIIGNVTSKIFTTKNVTTNKPTSHNVTFGYTTAYTIPTYQPVGNTLKCHLKVAVNQDIAVYNNTHSSGNTMYVAEAHVGDEVKVTCHGNASLEANCTNTEELALFNVTDNHHNCHFLCEEVDALSRQTCSVAVALLVNEQYLSSTSQLQGQNLVTQTSQPGSIFSAVSINIPVTFLIIFAGLFGLFLLLITALVIYVIKINCTIKSQSHVMLHDDQPSYNEISVAPNETTLQRTPSTNYYVENVGLHRYIEMRPISRNEEADSADKEQPVYSDIPHPLKNTSVQKSSLISSNEGTVHFNHCLGNVDLYGCMGMTSTRKLGNSNSRLDLVDRSPRMRSSMVPRLYSNGMYFGRDVKGACKVHPYSYAE